MEGGIYPPIISFLITSRRARSKSENITHFSLESIFSRGKWPSPDEDNFRIQMLHFSLFLSALDGDTDPIRSRGQTFKELELSKTEIGAITFLIPAKNEISSFSYALASLASFS